MRSKGSAAELEARRRLAVQRVRDGWAQKAVADFLGVSERAVNGWVAAHRRGGDDGLAAKPHPGPAPYLTPSQERRVLGWLAKKPTAFGYRTDLWTARRAADLIRTRLGVAFNPNHLGEWLTRRGFSPQKPAKRARERDQAAIDRWVAGDWPRIQKKRRPSTPTSS
jgi:transposase